MPTRRRLNLLVVLSLVAATLTTTLAPAGRADAYTTVVYNGAGNAPRIGVIGDSTIAALRWTNRFEPLKRFNFVYDAESCRRTAMPSCRGREGYAPENVITTMRRLSGQWGQVLVLMTGYDDPGSGFASAVDAVMAEAARQGIPKVMWLTMRTADVTYVGPGYSTNTYTFRDNNRILLQKSLQYGGRLQIADWATYSASRSDWFYADGIHLNIAGSDAAARFIADQAGRVISGETVTPQPGAVPIMPWARVRRGDRGASVVAVQEALLERGYSAIGGVDGVFGVVTETLVRRFQAANGLPVTGIVDEATAARLGLNNAGGTAAPAVWVDLRYTMAGTVVAEAQRALMDAGIFVRGGADGVFSIYTTYAVATFQRQNGLSPTGVIDAATAKALGLYSGAWIDLRLGMTGQRVRDLQQALIAGGINHPGGVTGTFAATTYYAVRTFQRFQRLPITGVVDAATARALGTLVAPFPSSVWANLMLHSKGERVAKAQRALMSAGVFVRGGATGYYSVYTYYAVNTFQRLRGLPVTGIIDAATARALGLLDPDNAAATWRNLHLGTSGPVVARLEQALVDAGVYVRGGVDQTFGLGTYYAVATFQRYNNLPVTGYVDHATARALGLFGPAAPGVILAATIAAPASATTTTTTTTTSSSTTSTTPPSSLAEVPSTDAASDAAGALGDLVWLDDGDGVQEPGEPGLEGIELVLVNESGTEVARTRTDRDGGYEFTGLELGARYAIEIARLDAYDLTAARQGTDRDVDSDLLLVDEERDIVSTDLVVVDVDAATHLDLGLVAVPPEASTTTVAPTTSTVVTSTEPPTSTDPPASEAPPTTEEPEPTTVAPTSTIEPSTSTTTAPAPPPTEAPVGSVA